MKTPTLAALLLANGQTLTSLKQWTEQELQWAQEGNRLKLESELTEQLAFIKKQLKRQGNP
jgi:hypothetical protein